MRMNASLMGPSDLIAIRQYLDRAGVEHWIDGGWAVDALIGSQTRPHQDLDLVIPMSSVDAAIKALRTVGFEIDEDQRPVAFTMTDGDGRKVDFHPVVWDQNGEGMQSQLDGGNWRYPAHGFAGFGRVAGQPVRCLTADVQILCHAGYDLDEADLHDLELLRSIQER